MMIRILVFVVGTTIFVHGHSNQTSEASLTISHQARSLQPGEVVLLNVVASVPTETVTAHAFDTTVYFFEAGQKRWQGLLGIDLQKKADAGTVKSLPLTSKTSILTVVDAGGMQAKNIGGVLQGKGALADEWLIIGGHYDHVGYGYTGTRYPGAFP